MLETFGHLPEKKSTKASTPALEKKVVLELDIQTSQRVRGWSHAWLQDFYDSAEGPEDDFGAKLDFANRVESQIAELVGESESHSQRLLTPRYREGIAIFLNSLIDFIENKSTDPKNAKDLRTFVSGLHEAMFSFSPNMANHIGLENLLVTTAKATRVPEAQGWFGQNMVGELVYELNWAHEDSVERILNKVRKLGLPEQLDVIHQLATIGADAIAQGEPGYQAHDRIVRMLEVVNQESPYPIVSYAIENSLTTIEREEENPSLGVITFQSNAAGARLPEELNETLRDQNETLKRQVRITNKRDKNYRMLPIASDAVGLFDHSNTPRQFAKLEIASLPKPAEVDGSFVERLREGAEARLDRRQFYELFLQVTNLLLRQDKNVKPTTSNLLAEKWTEVSSQFSREDWEQIFSVILKRQDAEESTARREAELREQIENENLAASNQFIELVIEKGKTILANWPNPPAVLREYYDSLLRHRAEGNEERAFSSAERFCGFFQINQEFGGGNRNDLLETQFQQGLELVEEMRALRQFHIDSWDEYNETRMLQSGNDDPQPEPELMEYIGIQEKLLEKREQMQADMLKFLQSLDQKLGAELVAVEAMPYADIELDPNLNPFRGENSEQLTLLLQSLHNPALRNFIEADLGINLAEIPLRSQIHLLRFLSGQNQEEFNVLRSVLQKDLPYKDEFLRSFLITAEDSCFGSSVIGLAEVLSDKPELGAEVFQTYDQYVAQAGEIAKKVLVDLQQEFPNLSINENIIVQSLLTRAKDFMVELETALKSNPENAEASVAKFIAELKKESPKEQVVRAQFKTVSSLLDRENIDLKTFEQNQELILSSLVKGDQKALVFRALNRMGRLSPIPEIHWRVDRSNEEYGRRLGVNLVEFLQERAVESKRKQILLEIGPGSGIAKAERASLGLPAHYQDVALSDKIYYPLSSVVEKLVDYSKLEQAVGAKFSPEEKSQFADFIYKVLIIAQGQTSSDTFSYDEQNQTQLIDDINNLKDIIPQQLSGRLKAASEVPSTISVHRDGQVVYPYKLKTDSWSPALQAAKKLLEDNPTQYMRSDWEQVDYYNLIDAFPANVMVGDLSQIEKLKDGQVDVELAVRSTVYKRGEEYGEFLQQLIGKLSRGGVAIDDSIRDNDGWYYRIAEVMQAKTEAGSNTEVLVVLGPGFPGEDKRQDRVPLSMIITKQGSSEDLIRKNLLAGYEVVKLEDLASDQDYLGSLDDTGLTREKITRQMELVS